MAEKIEHKTAKDSDTEFELVDDDETLSVDGGVTELDAVDEEETSFGLNLYDDYGVKYFYEDTTKESKRSRKNRKARQSRKEAMSGPLGSHMGLPSVTDDSRQDEGVITKDGTEANPSEAKPALETYWSRGPPHAMARHLQMVITFYSNMVAAYKELYIAEIMIMVMVIHATVGSVQIKIEQSTEYDTWTTNRARRTFPPYPLRMRTRRRTR